MDSKSETENTALGNTFNLVKRRGDGVPNSNTKGAVNVNQQIFDEEI